MGSKSDKKLDWFKLTQKFTQIRPILLNSPFYLTTHFGRQLAQSEMLLQLSCVEIRMILMYHSCYACSHKTFTCMKLLSHAWADLHLFVIFSPMFSVLTSFWQASWILKQSNTWNICFHPKWWLLESRDQSKKAVFCKELRYTIPLKMNILKSSSTCLHAASTVNIDLSWFIG